MVEDAHNHTGLLNLPNETINHILSFIPALQNLCLVNRRLRSCAEPFLYSTIVLERRSPIINLLHTLHQRPELLPYIETLSLQGDDWGLPPPNRITDELLMSVVQSFNLPFTDDWLLWLRNGSIDAFAALLIAQLSNTSRLMVVGHFLQRPDFILHVLQSKASGQLPKFKRLRQIVLTGTYAYQLPEFALAALYFPTVTELAISVRGIEALQWPAAGANFAHLTSLDVIGHSATVMAGLLARTKNLKALSWEWEYPLRDPTINFDEIIAALSPVKSTLERLQLRMGGYRAECWPDEEPELLISGSADGLADFDGITDLDVPLLCLAGFGSEPRPLGRCIPKNIEKLSLSNDMIGEDPIWLQGVDNKKAAARRFVEAIGDFATNYAARPPRLRCIRIINTAGLFRYKYEGFVQEILCFDDIDVQTVRDYSHLWERHLPVKDSQG